MPPPNLDYFVGTWSFDWNMPESPLGPAGKMKGTETYKKILTGQKYESEIRGEGPEGPRAMPTERPLTRGTLRPAHHVPAAVDWS